jgi:thiol-disulfide isomerase/thioredoxin
VPIVPMRRYPRLSRLHPLSLSAMALLCGSVLLTAACGSKTPPATRPSPAPQPGAAAISSPPVAVPRPPAPPPLLGRVARADLKAYASWQPLFAQPPYVPDPAAIAAIKSNAKDVTVLLILATWCPDSKRELPRYFAVMDAAGVADSTLTMVGVDRTKKDTEGLTDKWGVTRVPTFVFFRSGQEIGRVVERVPAGSTLEAEIATLLGGK